MDYDNWKASEPYDEAAEWADAKMDSMTYEEIEQRAAELELNSNEPYDALWNWLYEVEFWQN